MKSGTQYNSGDLVLARVQFTDTYETKKRPALILWSDFSNVVVAGVTSNLSMEGINLKKQKGLPFDSVIKMNYIFTVTHGMIEKKLCQILPSTKKVVKKYIQEKLDSL